MANKRINKKKMKKNLIQGEKLKVIGRTIKGNRKINEDNFLVDKYLTTKRGEADCIEIEIPLDKTRMFAIFDGMGGMDYGEESSSLAASIVNQYLNKTNKDIRKVNVRRVIARINQEIVNMMSLKGGKGGTTVSIAFITPDSRLVTYNIGDSPIYLLRNKKLKRISEDHCLAGMQLQAELIDEDMYERSRDRQVLMACLGDESEKSLEKLYSSHTKLQKGDKVIVASDGIIDSLGRVKLEEILNMNVNNAEMCDIIMKDVNKVQDNDNATIIMIEI